MPPADYHPELDKQNNEDAGSQEEQKTIGAATPGKRSQASLQGAAAHEKSQKSL